MYFHFQEFLTLTFTLVAVIDIVGSVPMLIPWGRYQVLRRGWFYCHLHPGT